MSLNSTTAVARDGPGPLAALGVLEPHLHRVPVDGEDVAPLLVQVLRERRRSDGCGGEQDQACLRIATSSLFLLMPRPGRAARARRSSEVSLAVRPPRITCKFCTRLRPFCARPNHGVGSGVHAPARGCAGRSSRRSAASAPQVGARRRGPTAPRRRHVAGPVHRQGRPRDRRAARRPDRARAICWCTPTATATRSRSRRSSWRAG